MKVILENIAIKFNNAVELFFNKDGHDFRVAFLNTIVIYIFLVPKYEKTNVIKDVLIFLFLYIAYISYSVMIECLANFFARERIEGKRILITDIDKDDFKKVLHEARFKNIITETEYQIIRISMMQRENEQ